MLHGASELGRVIFIDLAPGFRRVPVMASPVGVEGTEQSVFLDDLPNALETALRAFLRDKEHRVLLAVGIVHGDDQIPHLARHPLVAASILMDHHAGHRGAIPALAMGPLALLPLAQTGVLEAGLDPCVATVSSAGAGVGRAEVLRGP